MENKLTGNAIRVPTPNVSLAVLVLNLNEEVEILIGERKKLLPSRDHKYVSIGFGRYKLKGKENEDDADVYFKSKDGTYIKSNDQKRIMTPHKAVYEVKSDWLVIGRSITKGNIRKNLKNLIEHLNK